MKKIYVLLVLGGFLLTAAVLSRAYAYPALAVVPADLDSQVIAQNPPGEPATYFSIPDLAEKQAELGNQSSARADPRASEEASEELGRDVVVIDLLACTDLVSTDCSTERYALSSTVSRIALDPGTGEPVAWDGARLSTGGETEEGVDFEGLTIKFPFDAQKQTYQFWNADLRRSVPVTFQRETTVDGLRAYEYDGEVESTVLSQIDVPGSVLDRPEPTLTVDRVTSSRTSYLVEPESGVIISATSRPDNYATLDGERVLTLTDGSFTTPDEAAAETVSTYTPLSKALFAVRLVVPVVGASLGGVLIAVGLLLLVRRRRARPEPDRDGRDVPDRVLADA